MGGLYPRLARVNKEKLQLYTRSHDKLELHNDSVLNLVTTRQCGKLVREIGQLVRGNWAISTGNWAISAGNWAISVG